MTVAPILITDRLILRPHRPDDLADCRALWGDADVVRHIGGKPQDAQAVWFRILRYAGGWSLLGYGMWVVVDRATGAFLGEAGLLSAHRGIAELDGVPEIGWVLAPAAWGRGVGTEAVRAVLDWADAHLDAPEIRCIIEPGNTGSIAVARKCGFALLARTAIEGEPIDVYARASQAASGGRASP